MKQTKRENKSIVRIKIGELNRGLCCNQDIIYDLYFDVHTKAIYYKDVFNEDTFIKTDELLQIIQDKIFEKEKCDELFEYFNSRKSPKNKHKKITAFIKKMYLKRHFLMKRWKQLKEERSGDTDGTL